MTVEITAAPGPYAESARLYFAGGWANPIPVRGKREPVKGYTGYDGASVNYPDMQAWIEGSEGGHNVALRMAGTVAIDIDAHDGEIGNVTLERAQSALGDLPPTWSSTSRGQGESRILIYKLPVGCGDLHKELSNAEKHVVREFGPNVEILHRGHRYAIVWPSVHPDTGEVYRWYKPNGEPSSEPPKIRDLEILPAAWWEFLTAPIHDAVTSVAEQMDGDGLSSLFEKTKSDRSNERTPEQAQTILAGAIAAFAAPDADGRASRLLPALALIAGHGIPGGFWTEDQAREGITQQAITCGYVKKHGLASLGVQLSRGLADGARDPWVKVERSAPEVPAVSDNTWAVVDISPVINGEHKRLQPELGWRSDGVRLLYRGKEHAVASEPECGKTWWVLLQVRNTLQEGGRVVYLDFEDDEGTIVGRLLSMGTAPELLGTGQFRYVRPDSKPPVGIIADLCTFGAEAFADLVILDGMTEGLGLMGLSALEQEAIVEWRKIFVKPAMRLGAATLTTDHVVKQADARGRYAIGAQHKLAGLNGVMFVMSQIHPFGVGLDGMSLVSISKDRNGGLRGQGKPGAAGLTDIGLLRGRGVGQERASWVFDPPGEVKEKASADLYPGLDPKLRKVVDEVIRYVAANPWVSGETIAQALPVRKASVNTALSWLRDKKILETQAGPGGGRQHALDDFLAATEDPVSAALSAVLTPIR